MNENLLNKTFKDLRVFIYDYHFNGLDRLQDNSNNAAKNILAFIPSLQQLDRLKLNSFFPNVYFSSKADEITNVLNTIIDKGDRIKAYNLLIDIDPANISKYEGLKKVK